MSRSKTLRVIAVIALLSVAVFAALPWLSCMTGSPVRFYTYPADDFFVLRGCTVGFVLPSTYPQEVSQRLYGITGGYWGNLFVAVACIVTAAYAALSRRSPARR